MTLLYPSFSMTMMITCEIAAALVEDDEEDDEVERAGEVDEDDATPDPIEEALCVALRDTDCVGLEVWGAVEVVVADVDSVVAAPWKKRKYAPESPSTSTTRTAATLTGKCWELALSRSGAPARGRRSSESACGHGTSQTIIIQICLQSQTQNEGSTS